MIFQRCLIALIFGITFTAGLAQDSRQKICLGIDVLQAQNFAPITGQRVGLLTHPAGVNRDGISTLEVLLRASNVRVVALFGPEHGFYGDEKANQLIQDRVDARTGLPIYSLYGRHRKPIPSMLKGLDALVIDLQCLGVRSYTYISCMRKAMEACFENGVKVVVLDRPNPLGGEKVDGPPMERKWMSYVGAYQVPYVHGLTIGELALMTKKEVGWLDTSPAIQRAGKLVIVKMQGWKRKMLWPETGLTWRPTSPAIPTLPAALGYAMTGLGTQLGGFQHGYGTLHPFRLLTFPGKNPWEIVKALRSKAIPGLEFEVMASSSPKEGQTKGVYVRLKDWNVLRPTELSFYMMQLAILWHVKNPFLRASAQEAVLFNKHVGSSEWWDELVRKGKGVKVAPYIQQWQQQALAFRQKSRPYWLYD